MYIKFLKHIDANAHKTEVGAGKAMLALLCKAGISNNWH